MFSTSPSGHMEGKALGFQHHRRDIWRLKPWVFISVETYGRLGPGVSTSPSRHIGFSTSPSEHSEGEALGF